MQAHTVPSCAACGLDHAPGELFVLVGVEERFPVVVETCELESAWAAAHAAPQPPGAVAYHATLDPEGVLERGLDPALAVLECKHVCLAETPEIAAGAKIMSIHDLALVVLEVDVSGLDLFFELGEARHHGSIIAPERLRLLPHRPAQIPTGWSNPFWRRNHSDCIAVRDLPLSRRLLNAAEAEMKQRWPYDGYDDTRFRSVLAEHCRR